MPRLQSQLPTNDGRVEQVDDASWGSVLIACVSETTSQSLHGALQDECDVSSLADPSQIANDSAGSVPDLLILGSPLFASEFHQRLEDHPQWGSVPCIFLIESDQERDVERACTERSLDFFKTPLAASAVRSRVKNILMVQKRARRQNEINDARWRFAIGGSEFGYWDWDLAQARMKCSASLCRTMGFPELEQEVSRDQWLQWTHADDRDRVHAAHRALQDGEKSSLDLEYRLGGPERATVWVRERSQVLSWTDGVPSEAMAIVVDTTERRTSERRLVKLANYDLLTDLPNRNKCTHFILDAIERNRITGGADTLYRIDLSGLAQVNHSLGRVAGDEVLKQAAIRLKNFVASPEHVCRLGGTEFALLGERVEPDLSFVRSQETARQIADELKRPYQVAGKSINCECHVGACVIDGHLEQPEEVIRRAEIALDEAAHQKKSAAVFESDMLQRLEARTRILHDLKEGVFTDQFMLHYQPIVDGTGRITGVEALARWQHPSEGVIGPDEFIPLAEESGLIIPLGVRLRRRVCAQIAEWAQDPDTASLTVSVNVSSAEFRAEGFVRDLLLLVKGSGIDPRKLQLEVTESLLLGDLESVQESMEALRDAGLRLVLDDFGTGYSSLTYLKRLPFERLKLDRTFVRDILTDPVDASLSRAILAMAQNLGLEAIAEGVEEESQVKLLTEMGCMRFQGYLFSKPVRPKEVRRFCKKSLRSPASIFHSAPHISQPPSSDPDVDAAASILVVDDDRTTIELIKRLLRGYPNVRTTESPTEALRLAQEDPPDLLLLDTEMPEMNGFELWETIKRIPALADIPAVFVTALLDPETELQALSMGAADFVSKPISAARLKLAVRNQVRIKRQTDSLRAQASADPLTGIANRRSFDRALSREVARSIEAGASMGLLMIDVDHFKSINDECGHPAGDRCLVSIARMLSHIVRRPMDLVARYGGEEFGVILPLAGADQASEKAEEIVREVAATSFTIDLQDQRQVTVSVGWSTLYGKDHEHTTAASSELLSMADRALLKAKELGRNRVCGPSDLRESLRLGVGMK